MNYCLFTGDLCLQIINQLLLCLILNVVKAYSNIYIYYLSVTFWNSSTFST